MKREFILFQVAASHQSRSLNSVDPNCPDINLHDSCKNTCAENSLGCILNCGDDTACTSDCLRNEITCVNECPCGSECPMGCENCSNPICQTNKKVLAFSNGSISRQMILDFQGNVENDFDISYDSDTEIQGSCGASLNGQFWIIGGWNEPRQISRFAGCKLKRIDSLDFYYRYGACNTYQFSSEKILFCFGGAITDKTCHTFDGQAVEKAESTSFYHDEIFHLGSFLGQPMTVGSHTGPSSYTATEFMDLKTQKWSSGPEYPFHTKISGYSVAETSSSSYIIGGQYGPDRVTTIAEYNDSGWSKFGDLLNTREYHTSITLNGETMIFGGTFSESITTEVWNLTTGEHREILPELSSGEYWISILFLVEDGHCKTLS